MPLHDWTRVYAGMFHDFHQSWTIRIKDAMNAGLLPDGLSALVEQKSGPKESDVLAKANRIVVKVGLGRTIAVIEIVSPGNKDPKRAFKEFLDKSRAFIHAGVHLLVVDLFPPTKRDPFGVHQAIWDDFEEDDMQFTFPPGKDRILASYEADRETAAYVEPIAVGDVLPDMPLFLFDHCHIQVPLEATYQATWSVLPRALQLIVETGKMPVEEVG